MTTEQDVCLAIAAGVLPSPTTFYNAEFIAVRVSGVGCVWRPEHEEYAWRDPNVWLTERMRLRCLGLPLIAFHPKGATLNTEEFARRVIGSICFAWLRDDELWGVARVLDREAAAAIVAGEFDTSPAAVWAEGDNRSFEMEDGSRLLVEAEPRLLDHVAVVARGKWTKPGGETGVEITEGATA